MLAIVSRQRVLDRRRRLAVGLQPSGGAAMQHRHGRPLATLQLRAQRITKQVVVAIPLASPIERHKVEV